MSKIVTVTLKEIRDNFRDKRSFFFSLIYGPIIMPLLVVLPMVIAIKTTKIDFDSTTNLHVIGSEYAPNLIRHLNENNLVAVDPPENYLDKIREGKLDLVLQISPEYPRQFRAGERAVVSLYVNQSNKDSRKTYSQVKSILYNYSESLGYWRMRARGLDPEVDNVLNIVEQDLSSEGFGGDIFGWLFYFLFAFSMLMGGFYLAVDSTAGERERNSLEPLLSLPLSRQAIVTGKYLAIFLFIFISGLLTAISLFLLFTFLPYDELAIIASFDAIVIFKGFLLASPLAFLISSLLMATAAFTKSTKEAQTYISLLMIFPMVPMFVGQFTTIGATNKTMLIPFFSQFQLIDKAIKSQLLPLDLILISTSSAVALAMLLLGLAFWLYRRDKIVGS